MKNSGRDGTGKGLFEIVEGGKVILAANGSYMVGDLYQRGGKLYAMRNGGHIRLMASGDTSLKGVAWDEIIGAEVRATAFGMELAE